MASNAHGTSHGKAGAAPAVLNGPKQPYWGCSCGAADNWASRVACRTCGRGAPARIRKAAEAAHAAKGHKDPKATDAAQPARARRADGFELVLTKRQKREARKQLAAEGWTPPSKAAPAPTTAVAADTAMQVEEDGGGAEIRAINSEVKLLKDDIAFYEGMAPERRDRHCAHLGGYDAALAKLKDSLQEWLAKERGCKPLRQQLASAQSREDNLTKTAKAETGKLQVLQDQLTNLQEGIVAQRAKADKATVDLAAAKALVCKLAAEWAAGAAGQGTTPAQPATAEAAAHVLTLNLANVQATPELTQAYNTLVNATGAIRITGAASADGQPATGTEGETSPATFLSPTQSLLHAAAVEQAKAMLGPDFWADAALHLEEDDAASVAESVTGELPTDPAEREKALQEQAARAKTKAAERERDRAKRLKVNATKLSQAFDKRRWSKVAVQA